MSLLSHIPTATAPLLELRTLLKRVDTKFVLRTDELPDLLAQLSPQDYRAARHAEGVHFQYENLYFDTPERYFLRDHHRGRRPRYKVRLRHHRTRALSFIELKEKRPNGTTTKIRVPIEDSSTTFSIKDSEVISNHHRLHADALEEAMKIGFDRLMLVGFDTEERVTIDTGLWFNDGRTTHQIQDLVIVEVKQARFKARSPIMQALRAQKALQLRVSKYITGAQLLWPEIRLHRYNNRLRMLRRRIAR